MRRFWPFNQRDLRGDEFDSFRSGAPRVWSGEATREETLRWIDGTFADAFIVGFLGTMVTLGISIIVLGDGVTPSRPELVIGLLFLQWLVLAYPATWVAHLTLRSLSDDAVVGDHRLRLIGLRLAMTAVMAVYLVGLVVFSS